MMVFLQETGKMAVDNHRRAVQIALSGRNLFATGPAGSGKSVLIVQLLQELEAIGKTVFLCASTASAAHNLGHGATTLQSRFGFHENSSHPKARSTWCEPDVLIVDEISMIGPHLFAMMDRLARQARKCEEPMGGLRVAFVGDFMQLPPVPNKQRPTPEQFIFEMPLWHALAFQTVVLQTSFRQPDPQFAGILNRIRTGTQSDADVDLLEANVPNRQSTELTCLYATNDDVDKYNREQLAKIKTPDEYEWNPEFKEEHSPLKTQVDKAMKEYHALVLRPGAKVMLTANLSQEHGLVNGARGVFHSVVDQCPVVQFPDGRLCMIPPRKVVHDLLGGKLSVVFIPLVLAWGISIHKSQGQTLDDVFVDCEKVFLEGQIYVALSRASSLAGIQIKGLRQALKAQHKLPNGLKARRSVSEKAIAFYEKLASSQN
jgi:ATP-dependent DNA helicase PIF1